MTGVQTCALPISTWEDYSKCADEQWDWTFVQMLCLEAKKDYATKADTSRVKTHHRENLDTYHIEFPRAFLYSICYNGREVIITVAKMITAERRNRIAEHIIANGSIKAGELARTFGVSTETIRKDLIYLDRERVYRKIGRASCRERV